MPNNKALPEPKLRTEKYLNAIAQNTASGGGGGKVVLAEKTITENGTYNAIDDEADGYNIVTVDVAGTITPADEGKVVYNGALVSQTSTSINANGTVDTTLNNEVVVSVENTYTAGDEGKVVSNGALVGQTATSTNTNGIIDTTLNNSINVQVPNTYTAGDEGKVVDNGALVAQTSTTKNINGTYNTTTNNEVVIDVPNSYTAGDEGKVVSNGALISQTSTTVSTKGTYDTTLNNEVVVDLPDKDGVTLILYDSNDKRVTFILYIITAYNSPSLKYAVGITSPSNSAHGLPNTSGSLYTHIPLSTYFTGNINIELDGNSRTTTSRYTTILTIDVTNNRIDYTQSSDYSNVQAAWVGGTATNNVHNI